MSHHLGWLDDLDWIDIGDDHGINYFGWAPDRELNPQYEGIPDCEKAGLQVRHKTPQGEDCLGSITFDSAPEPVKGGQATWTVDSWDPLTVSPSLLCICGDHGFIREGRWVRA